MSGIYYSSNKEIAENFIQKNDKLLSDIQKIIIRKNLAKGNSYWSHHSLNEGSKKLQLQHNTKSKYADVYIATIGEEEIIEITANGEINKLIDNINHSSMLY